MSAMAHAAPARLLSIGPFRNWIKVVDESLIDLMRALCDQFKWKCIKLISLSDMIFTVYIYIYIHMYIYIYVFIYIYIYTRLYKKINRSIQILEYYRNKTQFDIWSSRSTSPGGACTCTPWLCAAPAAQRARWTERGGFCGLLEWSRRDTGHGMWAPHGSTWLSQWWDLMDDDCWLKKTVEKP